MGDILVVRLAKAEQITLELSSRLKGDLLDHFAIKSLSLSPESEQAARAGRHPMVSPARSVTLVHAVRQPLRAPSGKLTARRNPGDTFAVLEPDHPLLGIDPQSTAQLDVTADWSEFREPAKRDKSGEAAERRAGVQVQSVVINRGDERLKDVLRHEFGDTRHRTISYSLVASSRFRQFFAQNDQGSFSVTSTLPGPVIIPSSARPPPPVPLGVRPAFFRKIEQLSRKDLIVRRRRLGSYLRVELQPPWFVSGDGERLAVVMWNDANPPEDMWPFLTQAGLDPVSPTSYPPRFPTSELFSGNSEPVQDVWLEEAGRSVRVLPYAVSFSDGRYFADIGLPGIAAASYLPFVRLALTRYQQASLPKLELSSIVMTDFAQVLPDRTLTVKKAMLDSAWPATPPNPGLRVTLEANGQPITCTVTLERLDSFNGDPAQDVVLTRLGGGSEDHIPAWTEVLTLESSVGMPLPALDRPHRLRIFERRNLGHFRPDFDRTLGMLNHQVTYVEIVDLSGM
jgi:hypothetical protein